MYILFNPAASTSTDPSTTLGISPLASTNIGCVLLSGITIPPLFGLNLDVLTITDPLTTLGVSPLASTNTGLVLLLGIAISPLFANAVSAHSNTSPGNS